jgi:hypothetical protein
MPLSPYTWAEGEHTWAYLSRAWAEDFPWFRYDNSNSLQCVQQICRSPRRCFTRRIYSIPGSFEPAGSTASPRSSETAQSPTFSVREVTEDEYEEMPESYNKLLSKFCPHCALKGEILWRNIRVAESRYESGFPNCRTPAGICFLQCNLIFWLDYKVHAKGINPHHASAISCEPQCDTITSSPHSHP